MKALVFVTLASAFLLGCATVHEGHIADTVQGDKLMDSR